MSDGKPPVGEGLDSFVEVKWLTLLIEFVLYFVKCD